MIFFVDVTIAPHARYCAILLYLLSYLLSTEYTRCEVLLLSHVDLNIFIHLRST